MATKYDTQIKDRPMPNPTGDLVISGTQLGIGVTENLSTFTVRSRGQFNLTGMFETEGGSTTVTGTSTLFLSELLPGDRITVTDTNQGETATVTAIASNTSLTVDIPFVLSLTGQTAIALPSLARFDDGNGNQRVLVNDNGNVGIGSIAPQAQLYVAGDATDHRQPLWNQRPVNIRAHSNETNDTWQLVLSFGTPDGSPGVALWCDDGGDGNPELHFDFRTGDGGGIEALSMNLNGLSSFGSVVINPVTVRNNYSVANDDQYVYADATNGAITVTLPAFGSNRGKVLWIFKIDNANAVTIAPGAGDNINGATSSLVLNTRWAGVKLVAVSDGQTFNSWVASALAAGS